MKQRNSKALPPPPPAPPARIVRDDRHPLGGRSVSAAWIHTAAAIVIFAVIVWGAFA